MYQLISADSHVIEPPDLWTKRLPVKLSDRAPRITRLPDGASVWLVEDQEPVPLNSVAATGSEYKLHSNPPKAISYEDLLPGCYDPQARVKEQDMDSVDAEVLYPYTYLSDATKTIQDAELRLACYRAYNDWIAEFSSANPDRLIGLGKIPNTGITDATAELSRCGTKLKLKGVILDSWPHGGATPNPLEDDQFWQVAEELQLPVSLHCGIGESQTVPSAIVRVGRAVPVAHALTDLLRAGTFDRFPGLKIVVAHANSGWVPDWAEATDNTYMRTVATRSSSWGSRDDWLPSDYIRRFCWFTFQHDRFAVINRRYIGPAHMIWASHYPLDGSDWPDNRARAETVTQELRPEEKQKLLAENCARLYGLPGYGGGFRLEELSDFESLLII